MKRQYVFEANKNMVQLANTLTNGKANVISNTLDKSYFGNIEIAKVLVEHECVVKLVIAELGITNYFSEPCGKLVRVGSSWVIETSKNHYTSLAEYLNWDGQL